MKKVLNFFVNTKNGEKIISSTCIAIIASLVIGLILTIPIFWMGREYDVTWMNAIAPYFFYVFFGYAALVLFLFIPYIWHVSCSRDFKGDGKYVMKGMAIFCSIAPGAIIYSHIAKALLIPSGIHNLAGMLVCGLIYLWLVKTILRKPFNVAQTFIPLA